MNTPATWTRRILFAGLAIAILYVAVRLIAGAVAASHLEAELASLRAAGAPVKVADAVPPSVPDEDNAAVALEHAFTLLVADPDEMWELLDEFQDDPQALSEDAARTVQAWVDQNEAAMAQVEEAVRRPQCLFERDLSDGWAAPANHVPGAMDASWVLSTRGRLEIRAGNVDRALATSGVVIRLGRHVQAYPSLIDSLVGNGIEHVGFVLVRQSLSAGQPSRDALVGLLEAIDTPPSGPSLADVVTLERAIGIQGFQHLEAGEQGERQELAFDAELEARSPLLAFLLPEAARRLDQARYLRLMARTLKLASRPYREVREPWRALVADIERGAWYDRVSRLCLPVVHTATRAWEVHRAGVDLARIALHVELHEREEGSLPESLEELDVPGGVQDRLGSAPYAYRPDGEGGYLLYSVGPDGVDDGGLETDNPRQEGDVVWRRGPRAR